MMDATLVVDRARLRRWHIDLAERLANGNRHASLAITEGAPLPSPVELLLSLEQFVRRLPRPRPSERVPPCTAPPAQGGTAILDLSLEGTAGAGALRLLYDGVADEAALFGALLAGRTPVVEIAEAGSNRVLGRALPSIESAESLCEAYECVVARAATLTVAATRRPMAISDARPLTPALARPIAAARYAAHNLAYAAARRLYRLCTRTPHWRIGWRYVDGADVYDRGDLGGPAWRNLPNPALRFLADPVPAVWRGETWLLAEDFDHRTQKGIISAIPFGPEGPSGSPHPVLEEAWHLSYPFLIEEHGQIYMIPESSADRSVRLYRAEHFPVRWREEAVLLEGVELSDATIHRQDGRYWMFGALRDGGAPSDTLALFTAGRLTGPWLPHPANPVLIDAASARPAGNLTRRNGRLWRPVQDCRNGYGRALGLAEVTRLDLEGFSQSVHTILRPGSQWAGRRLHTLNRAGNLECIDGSAIALRLPVRAPGAPSTTH